MKWTPDKLANLIVEKKNSKQHTQNPNEDITNFTGATSSSYETEILKYDLKHGVAIRPRESEMIVILKDFMIKLWDIMLFKDSYTSKERLTTSLKTFTFDNLDIDGK